jgi:hypothetical protein
MRILSETTRVWNDDGKLLKIEKNHFNSVDSRRRKKMKKMKKINKVYKPQNWKKKKTLVQSYMCVHSK